MMGRVVKVCSICGADVHPRGKDAPHHEEIHCGTWEQLIGEIERAHRLVPEKMEEAVRSFIRGWDRAEGGLLVVNLPDRGVPMCNTTVYGGKTGDTIHCTKRRGHGGEHG